MRGEGPVRPRAVAGRSAVIPQAEMPLIDNGGGIRIRRLVDRFVGVETHTAGVTEIGAGLGAPFHTHNCEETVLVIAGAATFDDDFGSFDLETGDGVLVPSNTRHRFRSRGEQAMKMLWIYGSLYPNRTMEDSGETIDIVPELSA